MRRAVLFAALALCAGAQAMPLGLRTAMWGVAPASRRAAVESAFPALGAGATADDVAAILGGAADTALAENISAADDYADFREWAKYAGPAAVKTSGTAWLSYALGADALIGEIASDDVRIVSLAPSGENGAFKLEVVIDGVNIGGGAASVETLKTNLAKVLGVTGSTTLDKGAFSSDGIDVVFDAPSEGKARFTAKPPSGAGNTFFMRVKVK